MIYLELHYANRLPKVVFCNEEFAMKRIKGTKRRPNSADIQIGESIRAHPLITGVSQSDLAGQLGVSFRQIQKYDKGVNRVGAGRLPQIARICAAEFSDGEVSD
jgi:predicted transcriptional regulator